MINIRKFIIKLACPNYGFLMFSVKLALAELTSGGQMTKSKSFCIIWWKFMNFPNEY
jgi:hypothetical protein